MTRGSSLHDSADDGEDGCEDQVVAATNLISNHSSTECADETTALQSGDNIGLEVG